MKKTIISNYVFKSGPHRPHPKDTITASLPSRTPRAASATSSLLRSVPHGSIIFWLRVAITLPFLFLITIEFALYNAASLRWIPTSNLLWYCGLRFGFMHYRNSFNHSLELLSSVARSRPPRTRFLSICFLASILYIHATIANRATHVF